MAYRMNGEQFGSNRGQKLAALRDVIPTVPARSAAEHDAAIALMAERFANNADLWTGEPLENTVTIEPFGEIGLAPESSYADDYDNHYNSGNVN